MVSWGHRNVDSIHNFHHQIDNRDIIMADLTSNFGYVNALVLAVQLRLKRYQLSPYGKEKLQAMFPSATVNHTVQLEAQQFFISFFCVFSLFQDGWLCAAPSSMYQHHHPAGPYSHSHIPPSPYDRIGLRSHRPSPYPTPYHKRTDLTTQGNHA